MIPAILGYVTRDEFWRENFGARILCCARIHLWVCRYKPFTSEQKDLFSLLDIRRFGVWGLGFGVWGLRFGFFKSNVDALCIFALLPAVNSDVQTVHHGSKL